MGRSHQLPGAFFCTRRQQAKANECLSFCSHTGSAITCTEEIGVLATILPIRKGIGRTWSTAGRETKVHSFLETVSVDKMRLEAGWGTREERKWFCLRNK